MLKKILGKIKILILKFAKLCRISLRGLFIFETLYLYCILFRLSDLLLSLLPSKFFRACEKSNALFIIIFASWWTTLFRASILSMHVCSATFLQIVTSDGSNYVQSSIFDPLKPKIGGFEFDFQKMNVPVCLMFEKWCSSLFIG